VADRRSMGSLAWLGLPDESPRGAKSRAGVDLRRAWWTGLDAMVQYDSHGLAARRGTRCSVLIEHKRRSGTESRLEPPVRKPRPRAVTREACCRARKNLQLRACALTAQRFRYISRRGPHGVSQWERIDNSLPWPGESGVLQN
jgi:hypothetical protein